MPKPKTKGMDPSNTPPAGARTLTGFASATWYELVRWSLFIYFTLRGGIRVTGRANLPRSGGFLLVSNHASFLDPPALGVGVPRRLAYVARSTLFVPVFGPFLRSVGGFPLDREGGGTAGLKEALRRLKAGWAVLIFPEGTRTHDGELGPLKPGFVAMTRARAPIVPAGLAGTFEAWPRGCLLPRRHPVCVHYGEPILPEALTSLSPEQITELVQVRLLDSLRVARLELSRLQGIGFDQPEDDLLSARFLEGRPLEGVSGPEHVFPLIVGTTPHGPSPRDFLESRVISADDERHGT